MKKNIFNIVLILLLIQQAACVSTKHTTYFTDLPLGEQSVARQLAPYTEPKIQPDDILSITIQTIDPTSSAAIQQDFTMPTQGQGAANASPLIIQGFLVDKFGKVSLAMLGDISVGGLTTTEAKEHIRQKAALQYKNPTVQVRFANYKITVLGEVSKPATYTMSNEKVNLLDALGMAGDLTIFGKRENVLLMRENNGQKEFVRLNLNSSELFASPYFYLKQNDVIYVEPGKGKIASTNTARTQNISIAATIISLIIVAISRF